MDAPVAKLHDALAIQLPSNSHDRSTDVDNICRLNLIPFKLIKYTY